MADTDAAAEQLTGAQSLVRSLEQVGADVVFGIPGGAILPGVRPALRLRDGPAHPGPARAGRRPRRRGLRDGHRQGRRLHGHLRPGRHQPRHPDRRRAHGLGADGRDHRPGGRPRRSGPTPSRRPTSAASPCRSPSTASWSPSPRTSPAPIASAFHIAGTGRPGPVLVDITKDALQATAPLQLAAAARPARLPPGDQAARQAGARGGQADHRVRAARCSTWAAAWSRPGAAKELKELAELTGIPVVTTLMALGVFPDSHPQNMGMPGMHGTVPAVGALQRSDLLIALGTRFDDRVTGKLSTLRAAGQGHPRRHRPGRDLQEPASPTCRSSATARRSSAS